MSWNAENTTVADILMFAAWPDEMQVIARRAVRDELYAEFEEMREELQGEAHEDQHAALQAKYELVREHLAVVTKKLTEAKATAKNAQIVNDALLDSIDASVTTAIEMIESLPEELTEMTEPES